MIPAVECGSNSVRVVRLRLRGAAAGLPARSRLETALSDVTASALAIPPRALLIVRRLAPATPVRLDASSDHRKFAAAVRAGLAGAARRARRPWVHADAATADAVWFEDEAELLACLVRAWLHGGLAAQWWWSAVLDGLAPRAWWRRFVLPRGDVLPALLTRLAANGHALAWIVHLDEAEIARATAAVMSAHAIAESDRPTTITALPRRHHALGVGAAAARAPRRHLELKRRVQELIPELRATILTSPRRRLLGLSLGLQRCASAVRTAEFSTALRAIDAEIEVLRGDMNSFPRRATAYGADLPPSSSIAITQPPRVTGGVTAARVGSAAPVHDEVVRARRLAVRAGAAPVMTRRQPHSRSDVVAPRVGTPPRMTSAPGERSAGHGESAHPSALHTPPVAAATRASTPTQHGVDTQFGGIFYLLNVALALGLYGDFTQPRHPGIALSPWDWLALVGRLWFGGTFEADPVWRLLAELAGRTLRERPGTEFVPPDVWSIPSEWLEPWGVVEVVHLRATRHRVQLSHAAGFLLIDAPRRPGTLPHAQAQSLCAKHEALRAARLQPRRSPRQWGATARRARDGRARWLTLLVEYMTARLVRALGEDASAAIATRLVRHEATIFRTATHVDVHLALATLPLAIRIAGLDRDPGWIPAAGRTVAFHFA